MQSTAGLSPAQQAFAAAGVPILRRTRPAGDFTVPLAAGGARSIQELAGKAVFLNFWAGWCGPCRNEMPSMEKLYQKFEPRGLEILAVNYAEKPETVRAFMAENRLSFPVGLDVSGRITALYGVTAFPTTYIIDREGQVIARVAGSIEWDAPELLAAFAALLEQE
ncbi:MAG: TlpA family protein disulfide reductase [Candidatus Margulisbacteria bacterium]|nr:TlpA family protein disulfide reductase [Candidatus Margulisiibacteriota bacterium]